MKNKNILMVAYSEYSRDARIRREAEALTEIGYNVDFFVLLPIKGKPPNNFFLFFKVLLKLFFFI